MIFLTKKLAVNAVIYSCITDGRNTWWLKTPAVSRLLGRLWSGNPAGLTAGSGPRPPVWASSRYSGPRAAESPTGLSEWLRDPGQRESAAHPGSKVEELDPTPCLGQWEGSGRSCGTGDAVITIFWELQSPQMITLNASLRGAEEACRRRALETE